MSTPEPTPGKGGPWTPPHGGDGPGNGPGDAGTKKRPATKDAKDQKKKDGKGAKRSADKGTASSGSKRVK